MARKLLMETLSVIVYPGRVYDAIATYEWSPWVDERLGAEIVRVHNQNAGCYPAQPYFRFTLVRRGGGNSLPPEHKYVHRMLRFKALLLKVTGAVHDEQARTSILEC